jgi:hypothetical protein
MTWLLEDIMRMDFTETIGDIYKTEKTAIYNKNIISHEEVLKKIKSGEYDDRVIIIYKEQFENVFGKEG